jgi:aspartyl protease/uncharacterized protein DUF4124
MRAGAVAGLGTVLLLSSTALAQVYRWEDPGGTLHYTNTPDSIPESYRPPVGIAPSESGSSTEQRDTSAAPEIARSAAATRIPYAPGDAILVNATIAGAGPVTLILDTGADRTMVAPRALSRLGIALASDLRAEIRGVTGTGQAEVVQVASLEVGEARVGPLRIIVHDADLNKADGLLGRDFLEHFTVTIDSKERVVTLAPR